MFEQTSRYPTSLDFGSIRRLAMRSSWLILAMGLVLLTGCSNEAPPPAAVPVVLTVRVNADAPDSKDTYSGQVRARFETPLCFRIPGRLIVRKVNLGDHVRKGAVLAELDAADAQSAVLAAEAQVRSAEGRLMLARQTQERVSQEQHDDLVAKTDLEHSTSALAVAQADLEAARAQLAVTRNQSKYTQLIADRDGLITSVQAEVGAVLPTGAPVFGFAYAGERDAVIDISEDRISGIKAGMPTEIQLTAGSDATLRGRVREVAQAADDNSRTFRVRIALERPEAVRPGMTALISFPRAAEAGTVRIPATALFHAGSETAVWIVGASDRVLQLRKVDVSRYTAEHVLVKHGLAAGDEIVARGVHNVTSGLKVRTAPDEI